MLPWADFSLYAVFWLRRMAMRRKNGEVKQAPEGEVRTPVACWVSTDRKVEDPSVSTQGASTRPPAEPLQPAGPVSPPHRLAAMQRRSLLGGRRASAAGRSALRLVRTSRPTARPGRAPKSRRAQSRRSWYFCLPHGTGGFHRLRPCSILGALPGSSPAPGWAQAVRRRPTRAEKPKSLKPKRVLLP